MATEEYSIGYEAGYQAGWNEAVDKTPARVPLTKTRVGNYLRRHVHGEVGMYRNGFKDGVAFAEAAHGIGGGK